MLTGGVGNQRRTATTRTLRKSAVRRLNVCILQDFPHPDTQARADALAGRRRLFSPGAAPSSRECTMKIGGVSASTWCSADLRCTSAYGGLLPNNAVPSHQAPNAGPAMVRSQAV
jgi:hypothetical protein